MSSGFVAYYRVSTERQGRSGLGLDAQREAVVRHVTGHNGELIADFCEIESGKRSDRPQLAAAIGAAKKAKATLIIAKLDRLARNVHFISGLMESGVDFVAADNPHANRLMVHLLAAFAEPDFGGAPVGGDLRRGQRRAALDRGGGAARLSRFIQVD